MTGWRGRADEAQRAADEVRRNAQRIRTITRNNGASANHNRFE